MLLNELFGKRDNKRQESNGFVVNDIKNINSTDIDDDDEMSTSDTSGANGLEICFADYYVYEWFIKATGEIFYVGKGRGDRYKQYHKRAYEAEKIRKLYETGVRFVAKNLTEEKASNLKMQEITRILNETNDRLTNRVIPICTLRDNGYSRSLSAPKYQFETAPVLYASEIEEHYFGIKHRSFDKVEYECLLRPYFINKNITKEEIEKIYGGDYEKYYNEVVALLEQHGSKILMSKYAKSVTSWIYPCDDYVTNYSLDEENAKQRIGKRVPVYHLIDVWKFLKAQFGDSVAQEKILVKIYPVNNRVPLSDIKNLNDCEKGFDAGYKYWAEGDVERKAGNIDRAIQLFDKARYNGYFSFALYQSYAMAYRKLKDLENEIDVLDEAIGRFQMNKDSDVQSIITFEEQRKKAVAKFLKTKKVTSPE